MKKTLILVVDRDDDYGAKAGIVSPVVGFDNCLRAAEALGIADPEDSDTNALFKALNVYREMEEDPEEGDFEVALICGNQSIGRKSDRAVREEFEQVMEEVRPDSAILVGDGAEDEQFYKIISSRIPVDSVYKVIVKQAAGVEGAFYYFKSTLEDPQKRKRFLAPLSWIIMLISGVYILSTMFTSGSMNTFIQEATTPFIFFMIGFVLSFYAYGVEVTIDNMLNSWKNDAKRGSIMTVFLAASICIALVGVVVGFYSINEVYIERDSQMVLIFLLYSFWFFIFSGMTYAFGFIVDGYLNSRRVKYSMVAFILNLVSIGLVVNGILDYMMNYVGIYHTQPIMYIIEIVSGFVLAAVSSVLHSTIKKKFGSRPPEPVANEVF